MKNSPHSPTKPLTEKRKKILETALAQLKQSRNQMDPKILGKIRELIAENPKIMKKLGIETLPPEKNQMFTAKVEKLMVENRGDEEKINQAHNMDVIAKLMTLKPKEIENLKAVLLKKKD